MVSFFYCDILLKMSKFYSDLSCDILGYETTWLQNQFVMSLYPYKDKIRVYNTVLTEIWQNDL
jgi:hypothetical protein